MEVSLVGASPVKVELLSESAPAPVFVAPGHHSSLFWNF